MRRFWISDPKDSRWLTSVVLDEKPNDEPEKTQCISVVEASFFIKAMDLLAEHHNELLNIYGIDHWSEVTEFLKEYRT